MGGGEYPAQTVSDKRDNGGKMDDDLVPDSPSTPIVTGVSAGEEIIDPRAALAEMIKQYDRLNELRERSRSQLIEFKRGPICLVSIADAHIGAPGTDHARLFRETQIVDETPGMWLLTDGDMVHNMILAKMYSARFNGEATPTKEWAVLKLYLELAKRKLLVSVDGNHEGWIDSLTGIPYFQEVLAQLAPRVLFKSNDISFTLKIEDFVIPIRARHKWRYYSKYNPTHGIEDMERWDNDFLIGIGAHRHTAGLARQFNAHGETGVAVLCGTYDRLDDFAIKQGFPEPNGATAVPLMIDGDGTITTFSSLEKAAEVMKMYYPNGEGAL